MTLYLKNFLSKLMTLPASLSTRVIKLKNTMLLNLTHCNRDAFVILDDCFPWMGSGFRVLEFNEYLKVFRNCVVYSTVLDFSREKNRYAQYYPEYSSRINNLKGHIDFDCGLIYIVFLHNAYAFLPIIERYKIPFVLELYPGGFFHLDEDISDRRLAKVCGSDMLRKIIVTQPITYSYLIENKFCSPEKLAYIYGGVINVPRNIGHRRIYPRDKATFDICFTAYKQMPLGQDKGYDIFIQVAKELFKRDDRFRFHVVGTFNENDIDVSEIRAHIHFYGPKTSDFFREYYLDKDLILSPNRPFVLAKGAFDGIPTGTVLEAGACGVAMFCADQLKLTEGVFRHGVDIVIINTDTDSMVNEIWQYYQDPGKLYWIAQNGQSTIAEVYSKERQLGPRIQIIQDLLDGLARSAN
jgi:glycosyltransferase involved in cell wall biosynthesis